MILLDNGDVEGHDDLEILTVTRSDVRNYFTTMNATSAATALAANFWLKSEMYILKLGKKPLEH